MPDAVVSGWLLPNAPDPVPAADAPGWQAPKLETIDAVIDRGQVHERHGQGASAREAYLQALEMVRTDGDLTREVALLRWVARTHQLEADYDQALQVLDVAETLAAERDDQAGRGHCLNLRGNIASQRSDLDGAVRLYSSALDVAHAVGEVHLAALASQNLGVVASARGVFDQAFHHYRAAIDAYRSLGVPAYTAVALNNLGRLQLDHGDADAAEQLLDEALSLALTAGAASICTTIELNLAELWVRRNDHDRASALCDQATSRASSAGDTRGDAEAERLRGVILLARGDGEAAERHLAKADAIAAEREDVLLRAQIARDRAAVFRAAGRTRELLQALHAAHQFYGQLRAGLAAAEMTTQVKRLEQEVLTVVREWGESIEEKDAYTQGHCQRVADLASAVATRAGVDEGMHFWFRVGALLHDVGKIVVPTEVLNKTGKLTPDEWELMKLHPGAGADIVRSINLPTEVAELVRSHHENWDGSGYPDGLVGERIPLAARIVCLADVYDALTSERSYKGALSHERALEVMRGDVRRQFDPALFTLFEAVVGEAPPRRPSTVRHAAKPAVAEATSPLDELTGLVLRKAFLAYGREALAEAAAAGQPLSLAVIDIDHFKLVNDTFGHLQGDDVLRAVASILRETVRRNDLVGRYAGDEFVVLFPNTTLEDAKGLAKRLGEMVADHRLAIRDRREGTLGVTLSIGVATAKAGQGDLEALFAAADRALYVVKRRGRNGVAGADEAEEQAQVATMRLDRFVGRTRELRQLLAQLEHACSDRPRLVAVVGEAGIGKTSLVRQLEPEVRLRGGAMVVGRCVAGDVRPPYGAWAEIVEAIHRRGLVPLRPWRELGRLVPVLADQNVPLPAPGSKYALLAELAEYVRLASTQAPLVVVLDDAQWADGSTWDATEYLRHSLTTERLLLCMTVRAEDVETIAERRRHLSRDERFSELALARFTSEELSIWLAIVLHQGEIDKEFLRVILRYTEGNPLLVVHVLRSLQENGGLWYAGRRWQWKDTPELQLPPAVTDLIDARLDRLSERAREHLTLAAMLGRTFELDLVLEAGGMDEDALLNSLDEGVAAHVIEQVGDQQSERYAFSHGLIAAAIRRRVHGRRLARLHGQVAGALEIRHPDGVAAIAAHYDAAANGPKAFSYAMLAAERAVGVYAHEEAAASYAMAERHAQTVEERVHCRLRHAQALELAGRYEQAESLCDLIIAERVAFGDRDALVGVRRVRERLRSLRGLALEETQDAVGRLLAEAVAIGDTREEVELLGMLSRVNQRRGNPAEARALGRRAVEVAEQIGDANRLATTLMHLGSSLLEADAQEALVCYQRALATFAESGDLVGQARALINVGIAHSRVGANDESEEAYEQALALGRRTHTPALTGLAALNLGVLQMKIGRFDDADARFTEAMERFALLHSEPNRLAAMYNQANLARDRHDPVRAARLYGDAAVIATAMNQLDVELGARAGQGLAFFAVGRLNDARACLQSCSMRVAEQPEWWFQGRELFEALAIRMHVAVHDAAAARARFAEGLALAEKSDLYGAAWLVAEVAAPLSSVGVSTAREEVDRFANRIRELAFAPLTARYEALRSTADHNALVGVGGPVAPVVVTARLGDRPGRLTPIDTLLIF